MGVLGVDLQPQLFEQFTCQGHDRLFVALDLAAGLHEGLGAAFAHQQGSTLWIEKERGGNADDFAHGRLVFQKAGKDHMLEALLQSNRGANSQRECRSDERALQPCANSRIYQL